MEQLNTNRKGSHYSSFDEETNLLNMLSIEEKKKKNFFEKTRMPSFKYVKEILNNLYKSWPYGELVN